MNSATTTSVEATANGSTVRRGGPETAEAEAEVPRNGSAVETTQTHDPPQVKYRHVSAVHSKTRPSCLSHDSDAAPSFIGFRNLMVIVLGMCL